MFAIPEHKCRNVPQVEPHDSFPNGKRIDAIGCLGHNHRFIAVYVIVIRLIFIFLFDHKMDRFQSSLLIVVPGCVMITQAPCITPQLFGHSVTGGIKCGINLIC